MNYCSRGRISERALHTVSLKWKQTVIRAVHVPSSSVVGLDSNASAVPPTTLPCFPLHRHHFGQLGADARVNGKCGEAAGNTSPSVATPSDFLSYLCNKIAQSRERVILASLYIGVGSNTHRDRNTGVTCQEDKLLHALEEAASNNNLKKMQVLLDANRALRKVSVTNKKKQSHGPSSHNQTHSAEAVHSILQPFLENSPTEQSNGLFLFPVNDKRLCSILPSPLDEVAGVFHIKAYIVDDELILSGANLSEDYFSTRLDRYMLFVNGGGGLVDFYANLCDMLCEYAIRYDGQSNVHANNLPPIFSLKDERARKETLESSLMRLFDGKNHAYEWGDRNKTKPVAYATPTFQMPTSFLNRPLQFQSDNAATRNLLVSALKRAPSASVRLSSAYLNLTPNMLSSLSMYGKNNDVGAPYILTAGAMSHGFAPNQSARGIVDRIKKLVPQAFFTLLRETARSIMMNGGKILLYERAGWTFHAKGIWITGHDKKDDKHHSHPEKINNPQSLLATIIGSGNYGARSEDLDVESNCIIAFSDNYGDEKGNGNTACAIKEHVAVEWNNMCESSNELTDDVHTTEGNTQLMGFILPLLKRYL